MTTLEDFPVEVLLNIFQFLTIKDLIRCSQLSKQIQAISHDSSLWKKTNLANFKVSSEILEMILSVGCEDLNLKKTRLKGQLKLNESTSLKYLDLSRCYNYKLSKPLLASCFSLQKLSLEKSCLNFDMAKSIGTQNWTTLQSLDLHDSQGLKEDVIQVIVKNCTKLEEFSFSTLFMTCEAIGNSNS